MSAPAHTCIFIVDIADPGVGFVEIEACQVFNQDGDLIFTDEDNQAKEMLARGYWKRCKVRFL